MTSDPRFEILRSALHRIAWPIAGQRDEAHALALPFDQQAACERGNDPEYLKELARNAFKDAIKIDPAGMDIPPTFPKPGQGA